jgi:hypothetical protein
MSDRFLEALPEQREWRILTLSRTHLGDISTSTLFERENLPAAINNLGSATRPKGAARLDQFRPRARNV